MLKDVDVYRINAKLIICVRSGAREGGGLGQAFSMRDNRIQQALDGEKIIYIYIYMYIYIYILK